MSEQDPRVRPADPGAGGPAPTGGSAPLRTGPSGSGPLDLSQDPDRMPPASSGPAPRVPTRTTPVRPLDPSQHPDRDDRTLTEMLGEGAQEESRDTYVWFFGLLAVLAFLALVAFVASNLGP